VDDMLIASQSTSEIQLLKRRLKAEFEMKELGEVKKILGMEISRDKHHRKIYLSQRSYLAKLLARFDMSDAKAVKVPFASHFKLSSGQSPKDEDKSKNLLITRHKYQLPNNKSKNSKIISYLLNTWSLATLLLTHSSVADLPNL